MRYIRIFFLNLQSVLEERGRSFVWFLLSCINPFIMILFWKGASISAAALSIITSYYFFLMIGGSITMSHSEENIALIDIQEGRLVNYLLKPFRYFPLKWLEELPYRVLQGFFGFLAVTAFVLLFHIKLTMISYTVINIFLVINIIVAAIALAQIYKMCLGFISFWTTDAYGMFQFSEMLLFIFGGYIAPLAFYPKSILFVSYFLPFPYMVYFPIAAVAGFYSSAQLVVILLGEIIWIGLLSLLYKLFWRNGVKAFTGVGQ